MANSTFILDGDWSKKSNELHNNVGKYKKIQISDLSGLSNQKKAFKALRAIGFDIQEVEIWMCTFMDNQTLTDILGCMPKLEKIVMVSCRFRSKEKTFEIIEHKNLKELVMIESDLEVRRKIHFNL